MNVGSTKPIDFLHLLTISPSLSFGAVWLLGAAVVVTEHVHRRLRWSLVFLAVLTVGSIGGKSSNLPALLGGLGLAAVACSFRKGVRGRVWSAFAVALAAAGGVFVVVLLGTDGNLTLEAGASARVLGMLPGTTVLGLIGGTAAVVLVLATKWAGLAVLATRRYTLARPEFWFGLGAASAGLLLVGALAHPGASQFYFPVSSGVLATVVSAWGLAEGLRRMSSAAVGAAVVVGTLAGAVSVVLGSAAAVASRPSLVSLPHGWSWIAPYAVWVLPVLLLLGAVLVLAGRAAVRVLARRPRGSRRSSLAGLLCWSVVTASLVTGLFSFVDTARAPGPTEPAADSWLAWSDLQRDAMLWLREHSATDDVVATNRQCSTTELPGHRCPSSQRWFLTAALTGRRMYVEGADYAGSQPHPRWIDQRVQVSRRFVDAPTVADARTLWNAGVRWVVVDLSSTHTRSWTPYADPRYETPTTIILRLDRP
jgi:hypothetical protein